MANTIQLSEEEADFIRRFVADHDLPAEPSGPRTDWLETWAEFVLDIEKGYALTIYHYANELTVREILRDVMQQGPDSLRPRIETWLEPWDDRFLRATRPVVNPLDPNEPPAALARITRVPIRMGEELETDLRDNGIID